MTPHFSRAWSVIEYVKAGHVVGKLPYVCLLPQKQEILYQTCNNAARTQMQPRKLCLN